MSWKFKIYLLTQLPMGFIAGLKVHRVDESQVVTTVPFNFLTKNPFKSMYFAVQSMAAELSTAIPCLLAVYKKNPSVAFIIVNCKAEFFKKATSRVYFTCEDQQHAFDAVNTCVLEKKATEATFKTVGKMQDGTIVSVFEFTWSFKERSTVK